MSIFENLLIPLYKNTSKVPGVRFIDWTALSDVFDWEVERLAIKTGSKSNPITSLSGGNQQKVIIGRSFALHPKILILNDPARGIDIDTKRELYRHLREFAAEGNAVVYMSSELEEFIGFCSKVVVFRNGSIFNTYLDQAVEPVGILEGMFGRVNADPSSERQADSESKLQAELSAPSTSSPKVAVANDIERIRIVEFTDDQAETAEGNEVKNSAPVQVQKTMTNRASRKPNIPVADKIKISFFD